MKRITLATAALLALSSAAFAQTKQVIITDPGPTSTVVIPSTVRTYVLEQQVPSVAYDGEVVVGSRIPQSVVVHTVPDQDGYAYTIINDRRVIIDPQTHEVVDVLN